MLAHAAEKANGFIQRFISNPSVIISILLAILGQVTASVYFQITNNERQENAIAANVIAIKNLQDTIFSMQTPLGSRVIKIEDRIEEGTRNIRSAQEDNLRNFARLEEQQRRIVDALDALYTHTTGVSPRGRTAPPENPRERTAPPEKKQ